MNSLELEHGSDLFVPITWHLSHPDSTTYGNLRQGWLGNTGTPTVVFDGYEPVIGGNLSTMYDTYAPITAAHLLDSSPLSLVAEFDVSGDEVTVTVDAAVADPIMGTNLTIRMIVVEDEAHDGHDNVARIVLAEEPFLITLPGETMSLTRSFTIDPGWVADKVGVIVFVESDIGTKPVLQATQAVPNILAIVNVEAEPAGIGAGWTLEGPDSFMREGLDDFAIPVFAPGQYTLTWHPVPGWTSPSPSVQVVNVAADDAPILVGTYADGPFDFVTTGDVGHPGASLGVAMIDVNGDRFPDIHVVNNDGPDLLLINDGNGVFFDMAVGPIADAGAGRAAAWADYDSDGDLDCYLSRYNETNILLRNDNGVFVDATFGAIGDPGPGAGVSWIDFDLDGQLDLYLVNQGADNVLFRSFGPVGEQWFFLAQTGATAVSGPGVASAWADYDGDGDQDGFTTLWGNADVMLVNDQPFGFSTNGAGIFTNADFGTGAAWADFDDDGDQDLYAAVDGLADRLIMQTETGFVPVSASAMTAAATTRGVAWGDYDNDGDQDLYLSRRNQHDRLMRNDGDGVFTPIPLGVEALGGASAGAAWADVDQDGDLDLYVAVEDGPNVLLLNRLNDGAHWMHVDLMTSGGSVSPIGAKVRMVAGGVSRYREVVAGSGYFSQNSGTVEFGLGAIAWVDTLEVRWPDGEMQYWTDLDSDRRYEIEQGIVTSLEDDQAPLPLLTALLPPYPNPFNPTTTIAWSLARGGPVSLRIYDLEGRLIKELVPTQFVASGQHSEIWFGRDDQDREVAAGVYLARLQTEDVSIMRRVTLVK